MSLPLVHRLLYISRAHTDPCGPEPRRILEVATQRNAALGVTGLLCFSGDHFAQVLEGESAALQELMAAIRADARHRVLREWPAQAVGGEGRWFPGWSMGYVYDERLEGLAARLLADPSVTPPRELLSPLLFCDLERYRGPSSG